MFKLALIVSIGLVLLSALYSIISLGSYFRMCRVINRLTDLSGTDLNSAPNGMANPASGKLQIKIIDTPLMLSFVWGYLSNFVVISAGTLNSLSPDELRCLIAHEVSHYKRRDNILKGLLLLCRNSLFVFPHVHYLFRWWRDEIELIGDEAAVLSTGKPMDVASAILKMQRASATNLNLNVWRFAAGFTAPSHADPLTRRLERLVAINDLKIRPGNVGFDLFPSETGMLAGLTFLFPLLFGVIYEIDPLMIHCYLEKLTSVF